VRQATTYFAARSNPWVLTASEDWFGENATSVLADVGLAYKLDLMGMATERVCPPTRPLPDVQLRRIEDEENRLALADLNADSYGVPREWGRRALGGAALWESAIFGTIAYVRDEPASGAFALLVDDALYIGWVATAKAHRGRGFADLVIRKCLEDAKNATGLERTVLHATGDGQSVYERMGYRRVVRSPSTRRLTENSRRVCIDDANCSPLPQRRIGERLLPLRVIGRLPVTWQWRRARWADV